MERPPTLRLTGDAEIDAAAFLEAFGWTYAYELSSELTHLVTEAARTSAR